MELEEALNGAEMVINLAGKSINCIHNAENKKELMSSRIDPTLWIGNAIQACVDPPKLWVNASAAGLYKSSIRKEMTEDELNFGSNFLAKLTKRWEKTFFGFHLDKTRQVALRTSVVLGRNGGALTPLIKLCKYGLGGKVGDGSQMFSWIHIEDYFRTLEFLIDKPDTKQIYNCTAPDPVSNKLLMKEIRNKLHMPIGLRAPVWVVKFAAKIIGTESSLILDSSNVIPKNLSEAGFVFHYPNIGAALDDLIK